MEKGFVAQRGSVTQKGAVPHKKGVCDPARKGGCDPPGKGLEGKAIIKSFLWESSTA
jgi:hypothetical protein